MIYLSNLKQDVPDSRDHIFSVNAFNLPTTADLRPYSGEIEDQGGLGSCTANASASVLENLYCRHGLSVNLSRLFLYYVSRAYTAETKEKDAGCYSRDVFKAMTDIGVCSEEQYGYDEKNVNVKPPQEIYDLAHTEGIFVTSYERIARQTPKFYKQMKAALAKGYPVYVGMQVRTPFFRVQGPIDGHTAFYLTNDYKNKDKEGGHAVCIVGYDDSKGYWVVENSWGLEWGDNGYGAIPYGLLDEDFMDIWVITGSTYGKETKALEVCELWVPPPVVPFEGVTCVTDTYYVHRKSPTEQISYSWPIKFDVKGGVAPYTHYSDASFFKWIDGDTSTPILSYDWTTNPFRPNGGDYIEESSLTGHGATDSSFVNQTMKKKLRLVAIDYSSEHLPAEYSNATGVLRIPVLTGVNGAQFKKVQVKLETLGSLAFEAKYGTATLDASNPLALTLYLPKILVDGVMAYSVKVSNFTYSSAGYYD